MGGASGIRDTLESAASLAGNYLLPGSSIVTDRLVSKGSQKQLGSTIGKLAQVGTGLTGGGVGSSFTGIPSASSIGAGWGNLFDAAGNAASSLTGSGNIPLSDSALGATAAPAGTSLAPSTAAATGGGVGSAAATAAPAGIGAGASGDVTSAIPFSDSALGAGTAGTAGGVSEAAPAVGIQPGFLTSAANTAGTGIAPAASTGATAGGSTSLLSNIANTVGKNASWAVPAAGLAVSALSNKDPSGSKEQSDIAGQFKEQGRALQNYINTGQLPAGQESGLQQQAASEKAAIKSRYAAMGMSGSSAEQQDLAAVDSAITQQRANLATQLLQTGIGESNMAAGMYNNIGNQEMSADQNLGQAIANFGSAIAGGPRSVSLNFEDMLKGGKAA